MKKSLIAVAVVIIVGISGLAIAQMNDKSKEMMGDKAGMMDGKNGMMGMMDGKMMGMCPMMKSMMDSENKESKEKVNNDESSKSEHEGHH